MPKRWLTVGSLGIRKTRANLYFSGQVRYVSMSEALSSRPSPRVGRNGSREGSSRAAIAAFKAALEEHGLRATVRLTRGRDIDAACGQLAAKALAK
jgi:hypothetical protein